MPIGPMTPLPGSSSIAAAGYDPETQTLDIEFTSGQSYTYPGVPQDVYDGLMSADSPGKFFHSNIKGIYG
jgi:hypothetical protein